MTPIPILIVDDHPFVRVGIRAVLLGEPGRWSPDEAGNAAEAMEKIRLRPPGVALLDVHLPRIHGLRLAQSIREGHRGVRLLMMAGDVDPWTVAEALDVGAAGFLSKTAAPECLLEALGAVLRGQEYLCPQSMEALRRAADRPGPASLPSGSSTLSSREREILVHLAHGENTKTIAHHLGISPKTVETHRQHLTRKLGTNSVAAMTLHAVRHGWIRP